MAEPSVRVTDDPASGDRILSLRIKREELEFLSNEVAVRRIDDMVKTLVDKLADQIYEKVLPEVLANANVAAITNMATMRAGVVIGDRSARAVMDPPSFKVPR